MNEAQILQWCSNYGWTEPRQLEDGLWVAFPPRGYIEIPLPDNCQQKIYGKKNNVEHLIWGGLLILSACFIGALAVIISPLFNRRRIANIAKDFGYFTFSTSKSCIQNRA